MAEELLETEAVELPASQEIEGEAAQAWPVPARGEQAELSPWRGDAVSAALAAAGGLVAGAATVAVVRASRSAGTRRSPRRLARSGKRPVKVVASRSFLVDVHLLAEK